MKKISVLISNQHSTSISLEDEFYAELENIAEEQNMSINKLVTFIDDNRQTLNLSSAIRLYILHYYKNKLTAPK